jgi:thiamine-phosphate pyrophosphorylase
VERLGRTISCSDALTTIKTEADMIPSYKREARMKRFNDIDLYVVTCETLSNGRSNLEVLEAVIAGGGKIIQLRDKNLSTREFLHLAKKFREITRRAKVLLIINDYVDIAMAVDADGVHLGQEDMKLPLARQMGIDMILGRSIHSLEQARQAEKEGADYINIGPIFPTGTKEHDRVLGVEAIKEIAPQISIPFTVMGGITEENISKVLEASAYKVALVTAVTKADDMVGAVNRLRTTILEARPEEEGEEQDQSSCGCTQ